jgi:phospholipid/cholesterol/gamma-HCH transport system substrate-binding protein
VSGKPGSGREERSVGRDEAVRNSTVIGRVAAVAAVAIAVVVVAVILLSGGSSYQVKAIFEDASQLVTGDQVEVAGNSVGSVSNIALTKTGQAQLTLSINDSSYTPLHEGTEATVRLASLSGIANRYVDLRLGPANAPKIPSGGVIAPQYTTSAVDLDQLFNTLNPPTLKGLENLIQGTASQYAGEGQAAQAAWQYLNPAVAASSTLFQELNRRGGGDFTNFVTQSSKLLQTIAGRQADLSALVKNLGTTTEALASQKNALGSSIQQLPGFMALADTTFVNLRNSLDALTPLVNASKPVAPKLQKFLVQLRPLAQNAVPTVRNLANLICSRGSAPCSPANPGQNDLLQLLELSVQLAAATCGTSPAASTCDGTLPADGQQRLGAFPQSTQALNDSTPELAVARPYAVDLTGWFEGFSHPGMIDANGGVSRVAPVVGVGSVENGALNLLPSFLDPVLRTVLAFGGSGTGPGGSSTPNQGLLTTGQGDRCPGSMERGGIIYPEPGFPCNPLQIPTGN